MKTILPILLCLPIASAFGQSPDPFIVSTQGGYAKGSTMSLSWTIGDLVTETSQVDESIYTQGFQQPTISVQEMDPNQIKDITLLSQEHGRPVVETSSDNLNNGIADDLKATVYPNPFGADITVNVENEKQEYFLEIFDPSGVLLFREQSSNPQEILNLNQLPVAQYLLRIGLVDSGSTKIFRIVKSH